MALLNFTLDRSPGWRERRELERAQAEDALRQIQERRRLQEAQRRFGAQMGQAMTRTTPNVNVSPPLMQPGQSNAGFDYGTGESAPNVRDLAPLLMQGVSEGVDPSSHIALLQAMQAPKIDPLILNEGQTAFTPAGTVLARGRDKQREGFTIGRHRFDADGNLIVEAPPEPDKGTAAHQDALNLRLQPGTPAYNSYVRERTLPKPTQINIGQATDAQASASLYADRAQASNDVLSNVEASGKSIYGRIMENIPLGNLVQTEDYQLFEQARRDFINAVLRRESGAVISDSEFANAQRQYFPVPGDSQAVMDQKRLNRERAINGLWRAAGPLRTQAAPDAKPSGPRVGTVEDGYRFRGGNPADPNAWEKVN